MYSVIKKVFLRWFAKTSEISSLASINKLKFSGILTSPSIYSKEELLFVLPQSSACMIDWDVLPRFSILTYSSSGEDYDESFLSGLNSCSGEYIHNHISFNTEGWGESFYRIIQHVSFGVKHMIIANDDVFATSSDINKLFSIAITHHLDFYHPSLSRCSFYTHHSMLHSPGSLVRQANHIEGIFPGFSANSLACLRKIPCVSISGYGLDISLWPQIALSHEFSTAIVDAVVVRHMRPVASGERIYSNGLTAREESIAVRDFVKCNQAMLGAI